MMKIGVISDTHGNMECIERVVEKAGDVQAWFHCGDFASDAEYLRKTTGKAVYSVCGNCDTSTGAPATQIVELEGKRFFLTHGHLYNVYSNYYTLELSARENNCDAAVFGHTHVPTLEFSSVMLLNPGSPTRPLCDYPATFAIISICNEKMTADICRL